MGRGAVLSRVTDQTQDSSGAEDPESEESEEEEFELDGFMAREEGADVLRRLADDVESATVELGRDEGPVTVPERFEVEVEYEEGEEEAELEVELEWSMDDGEPVPPEEDESEEAAGGASDEEADDE